MATGIQKYLDNALVVLDKFGIVERKTEQSRLAGLLNDVVSVDQPKVTAIARVIQYEGTFNQLVRENVEGMDVSDTYRKITDMFNSIIEDGRNLVKQTEDGKIDWKEKASNVWMQFARGTTHARFEKITKTYEGVAKRTKDQLDRESAIMNGYMDFRLALKESEIMAHEVMDVQNKVMEEKKSSFITATKAVTDYKGDNTADKSRLELTRDEANRQFDEETRKYDLIKDVAEFLTVGYNVGETLVAKLKQTHDAKDRVYRRGVAFFGTNEHVFTTMDAVYTSQEGLHEATQSTEAMAQGVNKGLEAIAEIGNKLEREAMKVGYGKLVDSQSLQKLVDSVVSFQEESYRMADELRLEATQNSKEIARIVDEGKQRVGSALDNYLKKSN